MLNVKVTRAEVEQYRSDIVGEQSPDSDEKYIAGVKEYALAWLDSLGKNAERVDAFNFFEMFLNGAPDYLVMSKSGCAPALACPLDIETRLADTRENAERHFSEYAICGGTYAVRMYMLQALALNDAATLVWCCAEFCE